MDEPVGGEQTDIEQEDTNQIEPAEIATPETSDDISIDAISAESAAEEIEETQPIEQVEAGSEPLELNGGESAPVSAEPLTEESQFSEQAGFVPEVKESTPEESAPSDEIKENISMTNEMVPVIDKSSDVPSVLEETDFSASELKSMAETAEKNSSSTSVDSIISPINKEPVSKSEAVDPFEATEPVTAPISSEVNTEAELSDYSPLTQVGLPEQSPTDNQSPSAYSGFTPTDQAVNSFQDGGMFQSKVFWIVCLVILGIVAVIGLIFIATS